MNLDVIFNSLGPNKVTQPLIINKYEETLYDYPCREHTTRILQEMFNPIDLIRNKKSDQYRNNISHDKDTIVKKQHNDSPLKMQHNKSICIQKSVQSNPIVLISGPLSIWKLFLELEDKTLSLYDNKTQYTKVIQFRDKLIRDVRLYLTDGLIKKSKITDESLQSNIDTIFTYLSMKFNKLVYNIHDNQLYGNKTNHILAIEYDSIKNQYTQSTNIISLYDIYKNMCNGIDKKLVKDIRTIANTIGVSTTKIVDGKKKQLLKDELLSEIVNFTTVLSKPSEI